MPDFSLNLSEKFARIAPKKRPSKFILMFVKLELIQQNETIGHQVGFELNAISWLNHKISSNEMKF